ncbi:MAG TPA: response regulator [Candidatus Krumholzibacteria bacterium]|jgi:CheY-like chemotaxis protein/HPt (histidine-containing phosphotransfer) domain-containing protein
MAVDRPGAAGTLERERHGLGPMVRRSTLALALVDRRGQLVVCSDSWPSHLRGGLNTTALREALEQLAALAASRNEESPYLEADPGSEWRLRPWRDDDGSLVGALLVLRNDIAARHRASRSSQTNRLQPLVGALLDHSSRLVAASLAPPARAHAVALHGVAISLARELSGASRPGPADIGDSLSLAELLGEVVSAAKAQPSGAGLVLSGRVDKAMPERVRGDRQRLRELLEVMILDVVSAGCTVARLYLAPALVRGKTLVMSVDLSASAPGRRRERSVQHRSHGALMVDALCGHLIEDETTNGFSLLAKIPLQGIADEESLGDPPLRGRVLVVEDNAVSQKVTSGLLRRLGYAAEVAGDGITAMECLAAERFDAILMDYDLPGADGLRTTAWIREGEVGGRTRTPVIAVTASVSEEARSACISAGMDDYVAKPVRLQTLQQVLNKWTQKDPPDRLDRRTAEPLRLLEAQGLGDVASETIDSFLSCAATQILSMHAARLGQDTERLRHEAQSLKGAAFQVGATGLAEACAGVRALGTRCEFGSKLDAALSHLQAEFVASRIWLESERGRLDSLQPVTWGGEGRSS